LMYLEKSREMKTEGDKLANGRYGRQHLGLYTICPSIAYLVITASL